MNRIQFFTDAVAAYLQHSFELEGIELPVRGQVSAPEAEGVRVEVRCDASEEQIARNHFYRLDCELALVGMSAAEDAPDIEAQMQRVAAVCHDVFDGRWHYRSLPHPAPGSDPEYDARPFIVVDLFTTCEPMQAGGVGYEAFFGFRAYVQF